MSATGCNAPTIFTAADADILQVCAFITKWIIFVAGSFFLYFSCNRKIIPYTFLCNNIDNTGQCIGAIRNRHGAFYNFNTFNGINIHLV